MKSKIEQLSHTELMIKQRIGDYNFEMKPGDELYTLSSQEFLLKLASKICHSLADGKISQETLAEMHIFSDIFLKLVVSKSEG